MRKSKLLWTILMLVIWLFAAAAHAGNEAAVHRKQPKSQFFPAPSVYPRLHYWAPRHFIWRAYHRPVVFQRYIHIEPAIVVKEQPAPDGTSGRGREVLPPPVPFPGK